MVREPLHNPSRSNGQVVTFLSGSVLRRLLHGKPTKERARVIAQLVKLNVAVVGLSPAQGARLGRVHPSSVTIALGNAGKRGPHYRTLDRLIRRYGANTLMRALDRATAPTRIAAE
jgi:hypothetical protein